MLRLLAEKMRVGVRKNIGAMVEMNRARFPACVSRQPRVTGWVDVARAYALAHFKSRRSQYFPAGRAAAAKYGRHFVGRERWSSLRRARRRLAAFDLGLRHE